MREAGASVRRQAERFPRRSNNKRTLLRWFSWFDPFRSRFRHDAFAFDFTFGICWIPPKF